MELLTVVGPGVLACPGEQHPAILWVVASQSFEQSECKCHVNFFLGCVTEIPDERKRLRRKEEGGAGSWQGTRS
jgi:hypothetical protein